MPRRAPTIASTALDFIRLRGPQSLEELAAYAVASGMTRARDPLRAVESAIAHDSRFVGHASGRWYALVDQLEGASFVRRPTGLELAYDLLVLGDELHLLKRFTTPQRGLLAGGSVWQTYADRALQLPEIDLDVLYECGPLAALTALGPGVADGLRRWLIELGVPDAARNEVALVDFLRDMSVALVLCGPPGWLPRLAPGQLLLITVEGGLLEASAIGSDELTGPHVAQAGRRLADIAQRTIGPDPSWFGPPAMPLSELLEAVAMEAPQLLRWPLLLGEVLDRAGLELAGGHVGHRGTNWREIAQRAWLSYESAWDFVPPAEAA